MIENCKHYFRKIDMKDVEKNKKKLEELEIQLILASPQLLFQVIIQIQNEYG